MRVDFHITVHVPELKRIGAQLMASFAELQTHMAALAAAVHGINVGLEDVRIEIQTLKEQVAAGGVVTQAELDSLDSSIQATQAEAQEILTKEETL